MNALTLGQAGQDHYGLVIGIGAWLGTAMLLISWWLIWPQPRLAGNAPAQRATFGTRLNVALAAPMLLCMGAANHALPF